MSKQQMIQAIRERNRSVSDEFLVRFDENTLKAYLARLTTIVGHRGRSSVWVRTGHDHAAIARVCH